MILLLIRIFSFLVFIEIGTGSSDGATLNFEFGSATGNRGFEVKVTQYSCNSEMRPPVGCLQYHMGTDGRLQTFNFANNMAHLPDQNYNICLRKEEGMCCVEYSVCSEDNAFSLFQSTDQKTEVNSQCSTDWIEIEGGSENCNQIEGFQRFCGSLLGTNGASTLATDPHHVICDCSAPFIVGIHTDTKVDDDKNTDKISRGVCLNYAQIPCNGL